MTDDKTDPPFPVGGSPTNAYTECSAELSECGRYRWVLTRGWDDKAGRVAFIGLNPSTADALKDDPTIRRVVRFTRDWGFPRVDMYNLFPFRCTDPKGLLAAENPTGGDLGDRWLLRCSSADLIVAAWGAWVPFGRAEWAIRELSKYRRLHCLGLTKSGAPRHPLYMKADAKPQYFP